MRAAASAAAVVSAALVVLLAATELLLLSQVASKRLSLVALTSLSSYLRKRVYARAIAAAAAAAAAAVASVALVLLHTATKPLLLSQLALHRLSHSAQRRH
jgi:hypothetical protein